MLQLFLSVLEWLLVDQKQTSATSNPPFLITSPKKKDTTMSKPLQRDIIILEPYDMLDNLVLEEDRIAMRDLLQKQKDGLLLTDNSGSESTAIYKPSGPTWVDNNEYYYGGD